MYTKTPAAVLFDFISLNTQQVFFNAKPFFCFEWVHFGLLVCAY